MALTVAQANAQLANINTAEELRDQKDFDSLEITRRKDKFFQENNRMTFINEYIPDNEKEKYDIHAIDERYIVGGTLSGQWTVDKDRNIYLRHVANGRPDTGNWSIWNFYWKGELFEFYIDTIERKREGSTEVVHKRIKHLKIPEKLKKEKGSIYENLKEAFSVYKDGGVYATQNNYKLILDIEE